MNSNDIALEMCLPCFVFFAKKILDDTSKILFVFYHGQFWVWFEYLRVKMSCSHSSICMNVQLYLSTVIIVTVAKGIAKMAA